MRRTVFLGLIVLFAASVGAQSKTNVKVPWQWTDEERIAARTSSALAAERVRVALASETNGEANAGAPTAAAYASRHPTDIIDGHRNPELFLPTELFEAVIRLGLVLPDTWQTVWAEGVMQSQLPANFWLRLTGVASRYVNDLKAEQDLIERAKEEASFDLRERYARDIALLRPTLCRERAEALAAAREAFGPALDQFLYQTVARGKTRTFFDEMDDADHLRAEARGCR